MDHGGTLRVIEAYYDAAPRPFARTEDVGPFTVFIGSGWQFYARPRLGCDGPFDETAVAGLLARMRELDVPLAVEWVGDLTPDLLGAVRAEGRLTVDELPLMVLTGEGETATAPSGVTVRMLGPDDLGALRAVSGVQALAFGAPRTPPAGPEDRAGVGHDPSPEAAALLAAGLARVAVAEHPALGVLAAGRHIPVGGVTEVVGVATLPSWQGRGLARAVTARLIADAAALAVGTVFLTARDERVAALYRRLGFERVGTGYVAEA